jgi:hypothetical protein
MILKSGTKKKSEEEFLKSIASFEAAIQEDPNYVPPYLEMAATIIGTGGRQPHADLSDKAGAALTRTLARREQCFRSSSDG